MVPKEKKGMVLYSAVSSPLDRSKRFTLSSPDSTNQKQLPATRGVMRTHIVTLSMLACHGKRW